MFKRSNIHTILLALLFLLTEMLLIVHASTHDLYNDGDTDCELCVAAGVMGTALTSHAFEFVSTPVIVIITIAVYTPHLAVFEAASPLPRAPPHY